MIGKCGLRCKIFLDLVDASNNNPGLNVLIEALLNAAMRLLWIPKKPFAHTITGGRTVPVPDDALHAPVDNGRPADVQGSVKKERRPCAINKDGVFGRWPAA